MVSFTDITESIHHIRRTSKTKATIERISNFLRKKVQNRGLPAANLEEEINTLVTSGLLTVIKLTFWQKFEKYTNKDQENEFDDYD